MYRVELKAIIEVPNLLGGEDLFLMYRVELKEIQREGLLFRLSMSS